MEKEDFKDIMTDYTMIESITDSPDKIIFTKERFGIKYIESHYKTNLEKGIDNPVYIK